MNGYWLLVAHFVGDYLLQSDWMANEKTKENWAAFCHAATYCLPFLLITRDPAAIGFIYSTHYLIDRYRLARYVCWAKNVFSPATTTSPDGSVLRWRWPWAVCSGTGYHESKPPWMSVWLMIIADNTLHLICNGIAVTRLT